MTTHTEIKPDLTEIRRALSVLFKPGDVVEMRALGIAGTNGKGYTEFGYFNDLEKLACEAARLSPRAMGIYITLNQVDPSLLARAANRLAHNGTPSTSDNNVPRRRWILVDVDPERAAGISATDAEKAHAWNVIQEIRGWLKGRGWPDPVVGDSGNGYHLLYAIDLPAADGGLVERLLKKLALKFAEDELAPIKAKVDVGVFNPSRISKLYGTLARKGDSVPDRPHRLTKLIAVPDKIQTVALTELEELDKLEFGEKKDRPAAGNTSGKWLDTWLAEHNVPVDPAAPWNGGGRKWTFAVCPWNPEHTNGSAYIVQLSDGAISAGCHHNGCADRKWLDLRKVYEPDYNPVAENARNPDVPVGGRGALPSADMAALHAMGYGFRLNEMNSRPYTGAEAMTDIDMSILMTSLREHGYKDAALAKDAILAEAGTNTFHPIKKYLEGLVWDKEDHILNLAACFTDEENLFGLLIEKWLIGAVRRIYNHGQQHPMLVLDGPQGLGKSKFVAWLGSALPEFYLQSALDTEDKDTYVRMCSKWVWELEELENTFRKSDLAALKAALSKEQVSVRPPYHRFDIDKPATASFIGTLNDVNGYLHDPTGNRRFNCCTLTNIDWKYSEMDVNQVWAQAYALFRAGATSELSAAETALVEEVRRKYEVEDALQYDIVRLFETGRQHMDKTLSVAQVVFGLNRATLNVGSDNETARRIGAILTKLGCKKAVFRDDNGSRGRVWRGIVARLGTQTERQTTSTPPEPEGRW